MRLINNEQWRNASISPDIGEHMDERQLNGTIFVKLLKDGAANLRANRSLVNELNVFPIPDGDTGDNMCMTLEAGASSVSYEDGEDLENVASKAAKGMLLGARGNSGVILSRIFAGISKGLQGHMTAGLSDVADALSVGVSEAYAAVSNPVEGTMLTVYRDAVEYAKSRITETTTWREFASNMISELKNSLDRTPSLLEELRNAGVVDSGGAGLVYIAEGAYDGYYDRIAESMTAEQPSSKMPDLSKFTEDSVLEFGYCTEFLLRLTRAKTDVDSFDLDAFVSYLNDVGDSVVAFRDDTIVKVHVHTMTPGDILNYCQQYGEFLTLKIENMTLQHNENVHEERFKPTVTKPHKEYGIVTVSSGAGINSTFLDLGADICIEGGQSMNPSVEDFLAAFSEVNADHIIVFPNNSNIILTAKQAADLFDEADIRIVPSKTIGEGYAAISMLDTSAENVEEILKEAEEEIEHVVTGQVSKAIRDTVADGVEVRAGSYIGFVDDVILNCTSNAKDTVYELAAKINAGKYDVLLLIYGADVSEEEACEVAGKMAADYRRTEVIVIDGGQTVFDYILVLE